MSKIFVILSVLGMALATTACGGDSHPAVESCNAICDAQEALSCENAMMDNDTCKMVCDAYGSAPTECADAADAYYTCAAGAEWECGMMGAQQTDGTVCGDESAAMNAACAAE